MVEVSDLLFATLTAITSIALVLAAVAIVVMRRAMREARELALSAKLELESIKAREVPPEPEEKPTTQAEVQPREVVEQVPPKPELPPMAFKSLDDVIRAYELTSVMLFDSIGLPIDYVNVDDPEKGAALLAELASAAGIDGDHTYVLLGNGYFELVAKVERIGEKVVYVYVRASREVDKSITMQVVRSAREVLSSILSRRLER